jgi:hypothetical protein
MPSLTELLGFGGKALKESLKFGLLLGCAALLVVVLIGRLLLGDTYQALAAAVFVMCILSGVKRIFPPIIAIPVGVVALLVIGLNPAIHWLGGVSDTWGRVFPASVTPAPDAVSSDEQQPAFVLAPWYTERKNCHLYEAGKGDTGTSYANRGVCSQHEDANHFCQCANYVDTVDGRHQVALLDSKHTCGVYEFNGSLINERAKFNRLDAAACATMAGSLGTRFRCECD